MAFNSKTFAAVGVLIGSLALIGYGRDGKDPNHIKAGAIVGVEQQVAEVAQKVAKKKYDLDAELVTFNGYVLPSEAPSRGGIDVSTLQHKPHFDQWIKGRGHKLVPTGSIFVYPIAGYSKEIKSSDKLQPGSQIVVPNDPTNLGRSLLLPQQVGPIKLKGGVSLLPILLDTVENSRNLKTVELEASQLPRSLDDARIALAVINTIYASQISLALAKDGIFAEGKEPPYVDPIVAREDDKSTENVKRSIQAYQSDEVYEAMNRIFNGGAVKGW